MTLKQIRAELERRIARSHTSGGLNATARSIGVSKQLLHQFLKAKHAAMTVIEGAGYTKVGPDHYERTK